MKKVFFFIVIRLSVKSAELEIRKFLALVQKKRIVLIALLLLELANNKHDKL